MSLRVLVKSSEQDARVVWLSDSKGNTGFVYHGINLNSSGPFQVIFEASSSKLTPQQLARIDDINFRECLPGKTNGW